MNRVQYQAFFAQPLLWYRAELLALRLLGEAVTGTFSLSSSLWLRAWRSIDTASAWSKHELASFLLLTITHADDTLVNRGERAW